MNTRSAIWATGLVLLAAGCGAGATGGDAGSARDAGDTFPASAPPHPGFASGARLRAQYWDGGDGAVLWQGWYDRSLHESCRFAPVEPAGSEFRCVPDADAVVYTDSGCTQPAAVHRPTSSVCTQSGWVVARAGDGGVASETFYKIGSEIRRSGSYYQRVNGACMAAALPSGAALMSVAPEPIDAFVRAVKQVEPGPGEVDLVTLAADDGASQTVALWDRRRSRECQLSASDGRGTYCTGSLRRVLSGVFGDPGCTMRVMDAGDGPPEAGWAYEGNDTANPIHFYSVLGPAPGGEYELDASGTCQPFQTLLSGPLLFVGEALPDDAYPVATRLEVGSGRLRVAYHGSGAVPAIPAPYSWWGGDPSFRDGAFDAACAPTLVLGEYRCVRRESYPLGYDTFADDHCANPVLPANWGAPAGLGVLWLDLGSAACEISFGLYDQAEHYSGTLYRLDANGCVADPGTADLIRLAPADPNALPPVRDTIE